MISTSTDEYHLQFLGAECRRRSRKSSDKDHMQDGRLYTLFSGPPMRFVPLRQHSFHMMILGVFTANI